MNLPLKKYSSIFWTLVFLILSANTFAQSSYYWTQNFNTESSLLAGAVVGGNAGASAVYYNPALINQKESNKLALSANLVSLKSMKLDNLAGTGADYRALKLQFQPKFISYTGVSKKDSKLIYELAFLVPLHLDVEYNFVSNQNLDIIKRGVMKLKFRTYAIFQVLSFLDHFGIADDDKRVNIYGGAIAVGHPLASSGVRLILNLANGFKEHPEVRYGITTMCIGLGMGGTIIWENPNYKGDK